MEYTPEQQEDFKTRAEAFNSAYEALKKEHQCEHVHAPVYAPGPQGIFITAVTSNIGDTKFKATPSPFGPTAPNGEVGGSDPVAA